MKNLLIITLIFVLGACSTQRQFITEEAKTSYLSDKKVKGDSSFFLAGIGQSDTINAAEKCGGEGKVTAVESKFSPKTLILTIVTLGIYYPYEYTVYCKE